MKPRQEQTKPKPRTWIKIPEEVRQRWEEQKTRTKDYAIRIKFELLHSSAFASLRSPSAVKVPLWLHEPLKVVKQKGKRGKNKWCPVNIDSLSLTYMDANLRGLSIQQYSGAIKELHEKGFIEIVRIGMATKGMYTIYSLSNRWRTYGTDDFLFTPFPAQSRNARPLLRKKKGTGSSCPQANVEYGEYKRTVKIHRQEGNENVPSSR